MKTMKRDELMAALYKEFDLNAVPSEDFDGQEGGIWIQDDICKPSTDYYPYAHGTAMPGNVLNKFLAHAGWFAEPNDAETILIWK